MKKLLTVILTFIITITTTSCRLPHNTIIVGTMPHLSQPIVEYVRDEFYKVSGMHLRTRQFLEFDPINHALHEGAIHANLFQHQPFLNQFNQANNTNLVSVQELYTPQFTAWSFRIDNHENVPNNARVVIPNDASNRSRSLLLLEDMGLIELDRSEGTNRLFTQRDIRKNEKNLRIQEITSSIIPIALRDDDVYIGIIGAVFALPANLHIHANTLFTETIDETNRNVNILVVREEDKEESWVHYLISVLTSDATREFIKNHFQDTVVPSF